MRALATALAAAAAVLATAIAVSRGAWMWFGAGCVFASVLAAIALFDALGHLLAPDSRAAGIAAPVAALVVALAVAGAVALGTLEMLWLTA